MIKTLLKTFFSKKILTGLILLAIASSGYFIYQRTNDKTGGVQYVTATVEKGTFIVSIISDGQVLASNQIDIKPKVSGEIASVLVVNNQLVQKGDIIAQIDDREALKTVRDAELNLRSARLSLKKLLQPADDLSSFQAYTAVEKAKESIQKAEDDLKKAREDGFNNVANAFLDLPSAMNDLKDVLFGGGFGTGSQNISHYVGGIKSYDTTTKGYKKNIMYKEFQAEIEESYQKALDIYNQNFQSYKNTSRYSDEAVVRALIDETYKTVKDIAEALKKTRNLVDEYENTFVQEEMRVPSIVSTHQNTLSIHINTTNSHLLSLLAIKRTIQDSRESIINAGRDITEKDKALKELEAGADELDIASQELTVKQKQNDLFDAKEKLADYSVRASFDGIVTQINIKEGDTVSASTVFTTLITEQMLAEILLNEIDVSKIKLDQKTTLIFDAIDDLSIAGRVSEIDSLGIVSQGVVTYEVKISFDTQDPRIKPGMTVSAAIITNAKPDALFVPSSAVKSQNGNQYYVEVLEKNAPYIQPVQVGLTNDTAVEIEEGLKEGDLVVTQTIGTNSTNRAQGRQSQSSGFRIPGLGGGGRFRGGGFQQH